MKKTSILFLHSGSDLYGSDRCLLNILSCLDRKRFEPHVILPDFGPLHPELKKLGIEPTVMNLGVLRRKFLNPLGVFIYFSYLFFGSLKILFFIKQKQISIVHTNTSSVLGGGIAARLLGIPHLWHLREMIMKPRWLWRFLSTFIFLFSHKVLAMSEAIKNHCLDGSYWKKVEKIEVLYDGIDTEYFSPSVSGNGFRKEIGISEGDLLVGMIGRMNRWKGQEYLLEVATEILPRHPGVTFIMVGDAYQGEEVLVEHLKKQIELKTLDGRVILMEFKKNVSAIHSAIDIYVHPSILPEPFGLVVAEAMSTSKPVVANDLGGVREIILNGQTGYLVTPKNRIQMVKAIEKLIASKELRERMGQAGRKRIKEKFSMDEFKKKMDLVWSSFSPS